MISILTLNKNAYIAATISFRVNNHFNFLISTEQSFFNFTCQFQFDFQLRCDY